MNRLLALKVLFDSIPHSFFQRLAVLLALVLAGQSYLKLKRTHDEVHEHVSKGARFDVTELGLWTDFVSNGRQYNNSIPLTTRKKQLQTQADVKGANIDHNMSISNPCVTTSDLLKRAFLQPLPKPFSVFGQHKFIMRSAYRTSPNTFAATGLQLLPKGKKSDFTPHLLQEGECFWNGEDGHTIEGLVKSVYPGEHHNLMYETVIHLCQLETPTPKGEGGTAVMMLDGKRVTIYTESHNPPDPDREPKYFLGFCSFPMYRNLKPDVVQTWLQYHHHYVGVDYFVLNDGGSVDEDMFEVLVPYIDAGIMEVVDMRGEFKYETKHNVITLNDCVHKMAYTSNWVLFLDFDEFLYVAPPNTLKSILKVHNDAPYVTFGSLWWSTSLCRNPGAPFFERMLFHWPHFYCVRKSYKKELCTNFYGHRKFLVNPRKVDAVQVHRPAEPQSGGVDLNASIAHNNHFQGLLRADKQMCDEPQLPENNPGWWQEDNKLADIWRSLPKKKKPKMFSRLWWKL